MDSYLIPLAYAAPESGHSESSKIIATTEHVPSAEAEEHSSGLSLDPSVIGFQALNFLLLLLLLKWILYKPLLQLLKDRQLRIDEGLENAQRADEMIKESEITRQETIKTARVESHGILDNARKSAEDSKNKILDEAQMQAQEIISNGKNIVELERKKASDEIKDKTVNLVIKTAEKILKDKMDSDKDRQFIENSLKNYSL